MHRCGLGVQARGNIADFYKMRHKNVLEKKHLSIARLSLSFLTFVYTFLLHPVKKNASLNG